MLTRTRTTTKLFSCLCQYLTTSDDDRIAQLVDPPDDLFHCSANNSRPGRDTSCPPSSSPTPGSSLVTEPPICRIKTHYLFLPPPPPPPPQTPDAVAVVVAAAAQKSLFLFSAFPPKLKVRRNHRTPSTQSVADQRSGSEGEGGKAAVGWPL